MEKINKRSRVQGLDLLLADPRFQVVDAATRKRLIELLSIREFPAQPFDAVMSASPIDGLTVYNVETFARSLRLVQMKMTKKSIRNRALNGFLFTVSADEYAVAEALDYRYLFAFIVLNDDNDYERPFCELLTLAEINDRTVSKRFRYNVDSKNDYVGTPKKELPWQIEAELGEIE